MRELYALIHNLFADKPKTAQELIPLYTDAVQDATAADETKETAEAFLARMAAHNFFQPPTPKAEKYDVN